MLHGELEKYPVVITFDSLSIAMGAEKLLRKRSIPYSFIPTPAKLRTGTCNRAMCLPLEHKAVVDGIVEDGVVITGAYEATDEGFKPLVF